MFAVYLDGGEAPQHYSSQALSEYVQYIGFQNCACETASVTDCSTINVSVYGQQLLALYMMISLHWMRYIVNYYFLFTYSPRCLPKSTCMPPYIHTSISITSTIQAIICSHSHNPHYRLHLLDAAKSHCPSWSSVPLSLAIQ